MTQILAILLAVFKAIPSLKQWWDQLVAFYIAQEVARMERQAAAAIRKAIYEQDQRELEKAIGNPNAGKPVPLPGSEIVDSLPGVPRSK